MKRYCRLSRGQRVIFDFLKFRAGLNDHIKITVQELATETGLRKDSIKVLIWRMCSSGLITMVDSKTGCQGWRVFKFENGYKRLQAGVSK